MVLSNLLVANRGEIAIRIIRAAEDIGIKTTAIFSTDDANSIHTQAADNSISLEEKGATAYLNIENIIEQAKINGCDAIHPGYGFLSENSLFAQRCKEEGLVFVGPSIENLELFGNKGQAIAAAKEIGIPTLNGISHSITLEEASEFFQSLGSNPAVMIKAMAGGGGRGSRAVTDLAELESAFKSCQVEARIAFGNEDLYIEEFLPRARHIEVQIIGDHTGKIIHLGERECSVQRRHQKLIEIAPAPYLPEALREKISTAAVQFAKKVNYQSLGTFEFLVNTNSDEGGEPFVFIEANARLQVEHTVTEEVTGVDVVQSQLHIAQGVSLKDLGLDEQKNITMTGYSIQTRVNMEAFDNNGNIRPSGGVLTAYDIPGGPGIRVDGFGYTGYETSPSFDSLLAKLIIHSKSSQFEKAAAKSLRALNEFRIEGITTNIQFLQTILKRQDFITGNFYTRFIDENIKELVENSALIEQRYSINTTAKVENDTGFAGAQIESKDPLALFAHDAAVKHSQNLQTNEVQQNTSQSIDTEGVEGIFAPIQGTILEINVAEGDRVLKGQPIAVMEAMKMEHVIEASCSGIVREVHISIGDVIREGFALIYVEEIDSTDEYEGSNDNIDLDFIRSDLEELNERRSYIFDENRPDAVERRHSKGQRTARENLSDLFDADTFTEFGPLVVAAQRSRRTEQWLRERTPADGLVAGTGQINEDLVGKENARSIAVHYDYTVFAGTQGNRNHYKQDRMYDLAHRYMLPVILYSEGGGGRPGDTGREGSAAVDTYTFTQFSKLSGLVPLVGVNSGRCFAGNTALLACCDVIIATENSTIAMGGPAMIEGGNLGVYTPEEVGPMSFQVPNGVVDILVKDETEATSVAKKYLSYFQGSIENWEESDQRSMRHIVPENRLRMYNMREIIKTLADKDSVLEIRENFGVGIITCFIRIEGKPLGLIANNPHHLAGAIDSDGADKGARFLQLCDAFDLPVISLMDCPGMMVGPEVERTALVRHCARMFNTGANLSVPMFGIVIRKSYGLGVQAMCGASSLVPFFTVAWPTAEFAGMNIEGAVKLGYRDDLAAIENPDERIDAYERMVAEKYENAKAVNTAIYFGIDDVIDPADTRRWIANGLRSLPPVPKRTNKKRPYIDTW